MSHRLPRLLALGLLIALGPGAPSRADLDGYVRRPDASFAWRLVETKAPPEGQAYQFAMTSQTWQGRPWTHDLQVFEPAEVTYPHVMLLFITGGANRPGQANFRHLGEGFALAKACGARVAFLPQVPNQPLLDGKVEDDLIAETFVRFLATGDPDLPLLQPMVKSAVRAMDVVQAWAKAEGRPVPAKFVVSGASKRGWTTWLTAAQDPRVAGIAPMVIPTLNMKAQNRHQIETWGKYSEQIDDYVRRGLMDKFDTPEGRVLWTLVDPFSYRDRLTMPKLQINGTNDPYWTLDSLNLYWADLKGPSHVVYLPNAVHNLQEHRDWAIHGVGALFRSVASGRPLPRVAGEFRRDGDRIAFRVQSDAPPVRPDGDGFRVWGASAGDLDFRNSRWSTLTLDRGPTSAPFEVAGSAPWPADAKPSANLAAFADLTFEIDGLEYHLSSPITILKGEGPKP